MKPQLPDAATLLAILPEIWLVVGMCAVIVMPFFRKSSRWLPTIAAIVCLLASAVSVAATFGQTHQSLFSGALAIDPFSQFVKLLVILMTLLVVLLGALSFGVSSERGQGTGEADGAEGGADYLNLLLAAAMGMMLMASARHLLTVLVAMETASYPCYALSGFRKSTRSGAESAMKYVVFGSAASAVMIYGMSLLYGSAGSLDLIAIGQVAAHGAIEPMFALGLLALLVGVAFKLSSVPVHFWAPDVFQGAPTPVTAFLSVASKAAAMALLVRVLVSFGFANGLVGSQTLVGLSAAVAMVGVLSATWGNLAALRQTNIKRLLAYSSIAHAGYMVMTASLLVGVSSADMQRQVAGSLLFYLAVYLFMNLGAFAVASLVEQATGSTELADYAGLIRRAPALAIFLALFLLSLFGMPGLGGFMGKVFLMKSMADAGQGVMGMLLIGVLLFNTLLSLYYYLRPVYYMVLVADERRRAAWQPTVGALALLSLCALVLLWTGLLPSAISDWAIHSGSLWMSPLCLSVLPGQ